MNFSAAKSGTSTQPSPPCHQNNIMRSSRRTTLRRMQPPHPIPPTDTLPVICSRHQIWKLVACEQFLGICSQGIRTSRLSPSYHCPSPAWDLIWTNNTNDLRYTKMMLRLGIWDDEVLAISWDSLQTATGDEEPNNGWETPYLVKQNTSHNHRATCIQSPILEDHRIVSILRLFQRPNKGTNRSHRPGRNTSFARPELGPTGQASLHWKPVYLVAKMRSKVGAIKTKISASLAKNHPHPKSQCYCLRRIMTTASPSCKRKDFLQLPIRPCLYHYLNEAITDPRFKRKV